jgi:hypothetical protein
LTIDVSAPPGRLPPLRFGHTYQMRARIIDVANNALPVTAGADKSNSLLVSPAMVYGRQEPISSPDMYSQSIPRLSESLQRLVIRDIDSGTPSVRVLFPPRTSEPFAEWHGVFDTGAGGAIDPSMTTYNEIVNRESARYPDPPANPATAPKPITLTAAVPFLPDPLARGAALTVTNGTLVNQTIPFDFSPASGGSWPNYRPFGLQLVPGAAAPSDAKQSFTVDNTHRLVTFRLTEADTIVVNLTSTCKTGDVPLFALGYVDGVALDANAVATGQYWAITPNVQLELIYAVQKPLLTPEFSSLPTPGRNAGDTFADLIGDLVWSPKSTSTIDVLANWGEPVDDPVNNLPVQGPGTPNPNLRQTTNSPVSNIPSTTEPLASAGTQDYTATDRFSIRHEFFDTKHRNVTYHAVATSQFSEFYPAGTAVTVNTAQPVLVDILSSARPDSLNIAYVVPVYGWSLTHPNSKTTVTNR